MSSSVSRDLSGAGNPDFGPAGEIRQVFTSQWAAVLEIVAETERAARVDILALRGSEIIALADSLARAAAARPGPGPVQVRVLLLDPDSAAAASRAAELGEDAGSFAAEIRLVVAQLQALADQTAGLQLVVYYYATIPVWRMIVIDGVQYVSTLCVGWDGNDSIVYKLAEWPGGALYPGFRQVFDCHLDGASRVI